MLNLIGYGSIDLQSPSVKSEGLFLSFLFRLDRFFSFVRRLIFWVHFPIGDNISLSLLLPTGC